MSFVEPEGSLLCLSSLFCLVILTRSCKKKIYVSSASFTYWFVLSKTRLCYFRWFSCWFCFNCRIILFHLLAISAKVHAA